jgi:hypothetical protein
MAILSFALPVFLGGPLRGEPIPGSLDGDQPFETFAGRRQRHVIYERAWFSNIGTVNIATLCVEAWVHSEIPVEHRAFVILRHLIDTAVRPTPGG